MSFISWSYALLLLVVFIAYWRLPWRGRIWLLLAASYVFYGCWDGRFLALLLTSTTVDFFCGLAIAGERRPVTRVAATATVPFLWLGGYTLFRQQGAVVEHWILAAAAGFPVFFAVLYQWLWRLPTDRQRRAFLLLSILTNLGVLVFFKYFNFFAGSALALAEHLGWSPGWLLPHVILPVGISFYTFQSISYAVDIFKGKAQPARDPVVFAAYLSFFPQLVAGPIERPNDLLPQFHRAAMWDTANFHRGLKLILVGLFKKVFVGDNCALVANYAFAPGVNLDAPWAILGTLAFAFQIYGDFSGYTDIARGSARLEPLAHHAFVVVSRLCLYSARRQPWHGGADVLQSLADDAARRLVARRELDIYHLGRLSRRAADLLPAHAGTGKIQPVARLARGSGDAGDVCLHARRLGDFPVRDVWRLYPLVWRAGKMARGRRDSLVASGHLGAVSHTAAAGASVCHLAGTG